MQNPPCSNLPAYNLTPQFRKNPKSLILNRIYQRISFIKQQLKKQKDQALQDQAHLKRIYTQSQEFEMKIIGELEKCQQLKSGELKTDKNQFVDNLRTQNNIQVFPQNINLYNSDCINSKTILNSQTFTNQYFPMAVFPVLQNKQQFQKVKKTPIQQLNKRATTKITTNTLSDQKGKHINLKETFLTSIILILLGLVFGRLLLLF